MGMRCTGELNLVILKLIFYCCYSYIDILWYGEFVYVRAGTRFALFLTYFIDFNSYVSPFIVRDDKSGFYQEPEPLGEPLTLLSLGIVCANKELSIYLWVLLLRVFGEFAFIGLLQVRWPYACMVDKVGFSRRWRASYLGATSCFRHKIFGIWAFSFIIKSI